MPPRLLVKAPAKVMLFGEYCVLWGEKSLAFTPNFDMTASIEESTNRTFYIESDLWPTPVNLDENPLPSIALGSLYFDLIIELRQRYSLPPFKLSLTSSWAIEDGMGSSSALILCCFAACLAFAKCNGKIVSSLKLTSHELRECMFNAYKFQQQRQGFASGYDIASQAQGGLVEFSSTQSSWPSTLRSYSEEAQNLHRIVHVFRGGKGAPTQSIGKKTLTWLKANGLHEKLCKQDRKAQHALLSALNSKANPDTLAQAIKTTAQHRNFFVEGPSFPNHILDALKRVQGFDRDFSFKTSGAGGEDAIIIIGSLAAILPAERCLNNLGWKKLNFRCASDGLRLASTDDI